MKKKTARLAVAAVTLTMIAGMAAGCGSSTSTTSSTGSVVTAADSAVSSVPETVSATEAPLKELGTKTDSKNLYTVKLKNETGKVITGLAIKDGSMTDYPADLITDGYQFAVGTEVLVYYDASSAIAAQSTANASITPAAAESGTPIFNPSYSIRVTFSDGTQGELHNVSFGDFSEASIHAGDGYLFLTYQSLSQNNAAVSTEESEKAAAAAAAQAAQAAAATPTPTTAPAASQTQTTKQSSNDAAAQQAAQQQAQAEAAAQQQAAAEAAARQQAQAQAADQAQAQAEAAAQAQAQAEAAAQAQAAAEAAAQQQAQQAAQQQQQANQNQANAGCDDNGTPIFN